MSLARRYVATEAVKFNGEQVTSMCQELDVVEGSTFQVGKKSLWTREGKTWIRSELPHTVPPLVETRPAPMSQAAPFVTERIADSWMIQRGGSQQTGQKNAEWLTLPLPLEPNSVGIWHSSIFEAARFEKLEVAELALSLVCSPLDVQGENMDKRADSPVE